MNKKTAFRSIYRLFSIILLVSLLLANMDLYEVSSVYAKDKLFILDAKYQYFYHSQPVVFTPTFDSIVVGFDSMPSADTIHDSVRSQSKTMNGKWQIRDIPDQSEVQVDLNAKTTESGLQTSIQELSQTQGASFVSPVLNWQGLKVHFTDEIFLGFVAGTPASLIKDFVTRNGLTWVDDFGNVAEQGEIILVRSNRVPETNTFETANQLALNSIVSYAVPNLVFSRPQEIRAGKINTPEPTSTANMPWYITKIRAKEAWDLLSNKPSYSVRVAVIDEGVQRNHEAFPTESVAPIGYDAVNQIAGRDAGEPKSFLCTHGTEVAGTIIANYSLISGSIQGVGDRFVQVVPVNYKDINCNWNFLTIMRGILWAKDHANVLNLSFEIPQLQVIDAAISDALNAGIVVAAAAGNDNSPRVLYPANNPQVIAVGGTGEDEKRWVSLWGVLGGSNYGSELSIMAPASGIHTTTIGSTKYLYANGTSLSSPMVAAVSAMMHLADYSLTPRQIRDILQRTAYRDSYYNWDTRGWNEQMGYGRVDAYKAVEAALYPPKIMISAGNLTDNSQLVVTSNNDFNKIVYYNDLIPISNGVSSWLTLKGIAPGIYDFYLKSSKGLRKVVTRTLYAQPNQNVTITFENIIPGDANGDNIASLLDFSVWKQEYLYGCSITPCRADFNLDLKVDLVDFGLWKQAYLHPPHDGGAGDGWTGTSMPTAGTVQYQASVVADEKSNIKALDFAPEIEAYQQQNSIQEATTGMSYILYTDNGSPQVGQTINISAYLDTNGQVAQGASAVLHYDPAVLELQDSDPVADGIQVTTGIIYPNWYGNTQTNSGWIRLGGEGADFNGTDLFFIATFRVISSVPYTGFTITNIPGTIYESLAIQIGSENNFLQNGYYGILPISGFPTRQEPQISFIAPAYLREDHNEICIRVQHAQDTVRSVDLAVIDSQFNSTNILHEQQDSTTWCGSWDASATPDQTVTLRANVYLLGFDRTISSNIILDRTAPGYNSHYFIPHGTQGTDISISAIDNLAGVKLIGAYYNTATDGSTGGDWVKIGELASSSGSISWNTVGLTAGKYRVAFSFQDNADNWMWHTDANNNAFVYSILHGSSITGADTTGVFRPTNGALYLKNKNETGFADVQINYGIGGDYPVVGDWDGNGTVTIGIYRNGSFYLRNSNTIGFADLVFPFGAPGDQPVAGDWDGDGVDTIGVYRKGTFFLRNENSAGAPSAIFGLGIPGDVGIAGDWNGDGFDTTGVFRPSNGALYLKNANSTGIADIQINYGIAGDKPVTGDWDNDGIDTIGVYRNGQFMLRNSNTIGFAEVVFALGIPGDMPIAGNWDGIP